MTTDVWSGNPDTDRAWRDAVTTDPLAGDPMDAMHNQLRAEIGAFPFAYTTGQSSWTPSETVVK